MAPPSCPKPRVTSLSPGPALAHCSRQQRRIAANGYFFIFGGEGPNGVFDEMEMYVPGRNRWHRLEFLPIAVHGVTGSAFLNGWIHLPGGGTATGGSSGATLRQIFSVDGINP